MSISEFDKKSLIANYYDDVSWDARIAEPDFGKLLFDLKQKERLRCILSSTVPGVLYEANRTGDIRSVKDVEDVLIKFMNQSNMTASAQACECQSHKKSSWRHVRMLPDLVMTNSYE